MNVVGTTTFSPNSEEITKARYMAHNAAVKQV